MIRYDRAFYDPNAAYEWVEAIRAQYPDCIDYLEVGRMDQNDERTYSLTIYTEFKR